MIHDLFAVAEKAGDVGADLDDILANGLLKEHRVKTGDFIDLIWRKPKNRGDLAHDILRQIADFVLGQLQGRYERGTLLRIPLHQSLNLVTCSLR
jgi:hypothetical protein